MAPGMIRRVHRWAECHVCHKKDVTVTANGNLRKHDRPEGGEEPKPEAPAPQAPAAPAPKDDNRLVVIERTPLQTPPAAEESSKSKPGGAPTVTAVIKFLSAAGFQHSRYGDNPDRISSGARAQSHRDGVVRVTWREGFEDFVRRMNALGVQEPKDVPEHPKKAGYLKEYAEALAPRYRVEVSHGAVYVHRREELPARPPKVPTAVTVRKALAAAGIRGKISAPYSVVDQPDHTRVAVFDDTHLDAFRKALAAEGWTFTEGETWQHFAIKITGATPDQAARRRKLRQERASRAAVAKVEKGIRREKAAAAQEAPAPAPAPVATEEPATPTQEPEGQPVRISRCGPDGRRWWQGQRVVFKTRDMFLYSGEIAEFGEQDGESTATVLMDTRRAAPASRPMYKGDPNLPGKARPISPPEEWVLPLAKLKPA
jgi:hypothetical protein